MLTKRSWTPDRVALLLALFACFFLRLLWISDMEYKGDEVRTAARVIDLPISPIAGVSEHSGSFASSGFFFLMKALTFGSDSVLVIGFMVAAFNAATLGALLWLLRDQRRWLITFAACACSMVLVVGSRKIWVPDAVAPWIYLSMGCLALDQVRDRKWLTGLAGFLLPIAGHMYQPGMVIAPLAGIGIVASFAVQKDWLRLRNFIIGATLGALTYIPYFLVMLSMPHPPRASHGGLPQLSALWEILRAAVTLPTPYLVFRTYFEPYIGWMKEHMSTQVTLAFTLNLMFVAIGTWIIVFWWSLLRIAVNWKRAIREPLVAGALVAIFGTAFVLWWIRLGSYLHYWLGAIPLAFGLVGWACTLHEGSKVSLRLTRLVWAASITSALAAFSFECLVRFNDGLPGEYGRSYDAQVRDSRR